MSLVGIVVALLITAVVYLIANVLLPDPVPLVVALLLIVGFLTGFFHLPVR